MLMQALLEKGSLWVSDSHVPRSLSRSGTKADPSHITLPFGACRVSIASL